MQTYSAVKIRYKVIQSCMYIVLYNQVWVQVVTCKPIGIVGPAYAMNEHTYYYNPWPPFFFRINGAHRSGSRGDSESGDYLLLIHDETGSKDFSLRFPGGKRIREVKGDIHDLTSIPVRHQHWTGWPPNIDQENVRPYLNLSFLL